MAGPRCVLNAVVRVDRSDRRTGSRDNPGLGWPWRILNPHFLLHLLLLLLRALDDLVLNRRGLRRLGLLLLQQTLVRGSLLRSFIRCRGTCSPSRA